MVLHGGTAIKGQFIGTWVEQVFAWFTSQTEVAKQDEKVLSLDQAIPIYISGAWIKPSREIRIRTYEAEDTTAVVPSGFR